MTSIKKETETDCYSRKCDNQRPSKHIVRGWYSRRPCGRNEFGYAPECIPQSESSETDSANQRTFFSAKNEDDEQNPCRNQMHEQSYYGLPERISVSEDIRSKHADEEDENNACDSRKPEEKPFGNFFHYLDNLIKLNASMPAIITVKSWNMPIALRKIVGNTHKRTRMYATAKRKNVLRIHHARIHNR